MRRDGGPREVSLHQVTGDQTSMEAFDPDPFVERMPAFGFPWDMREMAPKT